MRPIWFGLSILLAGGGLLPAGGPPVDPTIGTGASGVFLRRNSQPMAKARVIPGEVLGDDEVTFAKIRLIRAAPVVTDEKGQFRLGPIKPGNYTIVYQPAGTSAPLPAEINIKPLVAVAKSILPLMRNVEVGTSGQPFADRPWGSGFTLLKGHTFFSEGPYMKIWNATVRRGASGPYLEIRKGILWQERLDENSRIRLIAWSY